MTCSSAIVRFATLAAFACASLSTRGQEDTGPWVPPPGSVAGPSSLDLRSEPSAAPAGYPPSSAAYAENPPPRLLSPVDRGFDAGPPPSTPAYERSAPYAFPAAERPAPSSAGVPPSEVSAPRREPSLPTSIARTSEPLPLPQVDKFDRDAIAPSSFDVEVGAEGEIAEEKQDNAPHAADARPLPPRPELGAAIPSTAGEFPFAASFGSLAVVLGLFFVFVWFQKSRSKRGAGALPPEVVEPLGTIPFVSRQALHVVRFGGKILLINVTAGGSETLAEIDDPREAERILALCRRNRPDPLGRTFREILGSSRGGTPAGRESAAADSRTRGTAHA